MTLERSLGLGHVPARVQMLESFNGANQDLRYYYDG